MKKILRKKVIKDCAVCGRTMTIHLYTDKSYRGGHYFGNIGIYSKKEMAKSLRLGTHKSRLCGLAIKVLNYDPKPYKYVEYWECSRCYGVK